MKKARLKVMLRVCGIAALASTISAAPASAQNSDDCRCADRDGNEIENRSCFGVSPLRELVRRFTPRADARPRIGISVDPRQSARNDAHGARVTALMEDGPAAEAGIRVGDVITSVDGLSLFEPLSGNAEDNFDPGESTPVQRLLAISADLEPGQEVEVEYVRRGETQTATVEARELSSWGTDWRSGGFDFAWPTCPGAIVGDYLLSGNAFSLFSGSVHGIELIEMKPGLASYFGTEAGILVTNVDEDSTLGLEPGDVILRIGDRDATSPGRVRRILSTYDEDEEITLRIMRDHEEMTVRGRLRRLTYGSLTSGRMIPKSLSRSPS